MLSKFLLLSSVALSAAAIAAPALAGEGPRKIVTVAFGAGLNTAQPGNAANHHIIPGTIVVKAGDIVNFAVAGLHYIRVYGKGVTLADVRGQIPDACEVNPVPALPECASGTPVPVVPLGSLATYYVGINPFTIPQPGPPFAVPSAATNRVEPVAFLNPGKYLVICAVLPHFNDKMYAWVVVTPSGGRDDHGESH
jgi:plastocyanin